MTYENADDEQRRYADELRAAVDKAMRAQYEPTGLVLHPIDKAVVDVHDLRRTEADQARRIEMQKQIADAFEIPYWMAGVDGYRAPFKVRWHPRNVKYRVRARLRRWIGRLPLVYDYGWMPTNSVESYFWEGSEARRGRWWVHVGVFRIGWGWDKEDW